MSYNSNVCKELFFFFFWGGGGGGGGEALSGYIGSIYVIIIYDTLLTGLKT